MIVQHIVMPKGKAHRKIPDIVKQWELVCTLTNCNLEK